MERVILGLGGNLGRPAEQIAAALRRLESAVRVERVSSLYRSAPQGYAEQPDFLNLVAVGVTALSPRDVLAVLQETERALGRLRSFRNAPRPIDIDLLDHGGSVLDTPELVLPHPAIAERGFVLHPLAEVAPEWRHPLLGRTARELLSGPAALQRVERVGPLPGEPERGAGA